ncbi:uncharacterized protein LOC134816583 [Bolinopsis microptera]|uniref:uncharacterized protein LOC134816583 n=1 Tax=Bolinopsis microptera TaxID=2820187 RepID=UPI00307A056E
MFSFKLFFVIFFFTSASSIRTANRASVNRRIRYKVSLDIEPAAGDSSVGLGEIMDDSMIDKLEADSKDDGIGFDWFKEAEADTEEEDEAEEEEELIPLKRRGPLCYKKREGKGCSTNFKGLRRKDSWWVFKRYRCVVKVYSSREDFDCVIYMRHDEEDQRMINERGIRYTVEYNWRKMLELGYEDSDTEISETSVKKNKKRKKGKTVRKKKGKNKRKKKG